MQNIHLRIHYHDNKPPLAFWQQVMNWKGHGELQIGYLWTPVRYQQNFYG